MTLLRGLLLFLTMICTGCGGALDPEALEIVSVKQRGDMVRIKVKDPAETHYWYARQESRQTEDAVKVSIIKQKSEPASLGYPMAIDVAVKIDPTVREVYLTNGFHDKLVWQRDAQPYLPDPPREPAPQPRAAPRKNAPPRKPPPAERPSGDDGMVP